MLFHGTKHSSIGDKSELNIFEEIKQYHFDTIKENEYEIIVVEQKPATTLNQVQLIEFGSYFAHVLWQEKCKLNQIEEKLHPFIVLLTEKNEIKFQQLEKSSKYQHHKEQINLKSIIEYDEYINLVVEKG